MLEKCAERILAQSRSKGIQQADVFLRRRRSTMIEVEGGEIETLKISEDAGAGLRIIVDGRLGFAHSSDLSGDALDELVDKALAASSCVTLDEYTHIPSARYAYEDMHLSDPSLATRTVEEKVQVAIEVERAALDFDKRVSKVRGASYADSDVETVLMNTHDLNVSFSSTLCTASGAAIAEEKDEAEMGWEFDYSRHFSDLNPSEVGRSAAQRAVSLLGARPVASTKAPILLDSYVAANFLAVIAAAVLADNVQKKKSIFAGKMDSMVSSEVVTITDDGSLPEGMNAAPADDEGVPSQKTPVVESGRLTSFLHNCYTAARDGVSSTGNGVRRSYRQLPEVGPTNFYLLPGKLSKEEMIDKCGTGLYVMSVMGMHTTDPISGDFSVGASGIWIEDGELAFPVRGVTIAGNIGELLTHVRQVGNDLRFYDRYGAPCILVEDAAISGK